MRADPIWTRINAATSKRWIHTAYPMMGGILDRLP